MPSTSQEQEVRSWSLWATACHLLRVRKQNPRLWPLAPAVAKMAQESKPPCPEPDLLLIIILYRPIPIPTPTPSRPFNSFPPSASSPIYSRPLLDCGCHPPSCAACEPPVWQRSTNSVARHLLPSRGLFVQPLVKPVQSIPVLRWALLPSSVYPSLLRTPIILYLL
jgi:hypothetical protein